MEEIEKKVMKVDKIEKGIEEISEMLKKIPAIIKFLKEEIIVDVKLMSATRWLKIIVDRGAPFSKVSEKWLKKYIEEKAVMEKDLEYKIVWEDLGLEIMYI